MYKAFITDVDGTLTDGRRRLSTQAVEEIRRLIDADIPVVLASGNTLCFLDGLSHMIGTDGNVIAENGGVFRKGFLGKRTVAGNRALCMEAYEKIRAEVQPKGDELRLFSAELRHSDVAFSRDVSIDRVNEIIAGMDVVAVDTGFAIHLHTPGLSKGAAFEMLAKNTNASQATAKNRGAVIPTAILASPPALQSRFRRRNYTAPLSKHSVILILIK